jgi:hypothetical protein
MNVGIRWRWVPDEHQLWNHNPHGSNRKSLRHWLEFTFDGTLHGIRPWNGSNHKWCYKYCTGHSAKSFIDGLRLQAAEQYAVVDQ